MCTTLIVKSRGNAVAKTGATHYNAQLGLLRQRSRNHRVGCLIGVTQLNTPGVWTEKESFGSPWLFWIVGP